jgi:hypothetical protein
MGLGTSQVMPLVNSAMNRNAGEHAGVAGAVGKTLRKFGVVSAERLYLRGWPTRSNRKANAPQSAIAPKKPAKERLPRLRHPRRGGGLF